MLIELIIGFFIWLVNQKTDPSKNWILVIGFIWVGVFDGRDANWLLSELLHGF